MKKGKLLVVGIDGGSWNIINDVLDKEKLNFFEEIVENGVATTLKSTIPPQTIPAWPSMFTGKLPESIGFFGFAKPVDFQGNFDFFDSDICNDGFIWNILNQNGYSTAVINVPGTYPPLPLDGILVSGMMTPKDVNDFYYPKDLDMNNYEIDLTKGVTLLDEGEILKESLEVNEKRFEFIKKRFEKQSFDVSFVVFSITDRIQHFSNNEDYFIRVYKEIDRQLEILSDFYENIIIVSDHGFTKLENPLFLNNWLEKQGFLNKKNSFISSIAKKVPNKIVGSIINYIPNSLFEFFNLDDMIKNAPVETQSINFQESEAFSIVDNQITAKDRETAMEIKNKLQTEGIFDEIKLTRDNDMYHLILSPKEGNFGYSVSKDLFENKINKDGEHTRDGIFIAYGEDINNGEDYSCLDINSIAPTICYCMDIQVPEDMDGKPVKSLFKR